MIFTTLALAIGTSARRVSLQVSSPESDVGKLVHIHSGAGSDYFFLDDNYPATDVYEVDDENKVTLVTDSQYTYNVGAQGKWFSVGPLITPLKFQLGDNGIISNFNFWGCYDFDDPYHYSDNARAVLVTEAGNNFIPGQKCIALKVFIRDIPY